MFPILFSAGPITIYTINVLYVVSWCVFSFIFWKYLRHHGVLEERIFDLTFYSTITALIGARLGYVFLYPQLFTPSILLIGAFWVQPGLWVYAGVFSMFLTFLLYSKKVNVRLSQIFDALIVALPWIFTVITLGSFFQGEEVGYPTSLPWGIQYPHTDGIRHPVQLYEGIVFLFVGLISIRLMKQSFENKWQSGLLGTLILTILTPLLFGIEFLKVGPLYLYGISINQWLLIILFAESFGMVFTKGGLHEQITSAIRRRNQKQTDPREGQNQTEDHRIEGPGSVSGS